MVDTHVEQYLHLVDVTHEAVLLAWGAFWFERRNGRWAIVDDSRLGGVAGRRTCIGASAEPFGTTTVRVLDAAGRVVAEEKPEGYAATWVRGLQPDTEYRYRVEVDGAEWATGELWDIAPVPEGGLDMRPSGRSYDTRFRTVPAPDGPSPAVAFAVLGDFGVGVASDAESSRRQQRVADALEMTAATRDVRFLLTTGDNVYIGEQGRVDDESGGEDDDWFSSYFQPYRYLLARLPVYPTMGNHDGAETEGSDDRAQTIDNLHLESRFTSGNDASFEPGLFYRVRHGADIELISIDTSHSDDRPKSRYYQDEGHFAWIDKAFAEPGPRWRVPFCHHPPYCAGPEHYDDAELVRDLVPRYQRGGVRVVLAGHEHNFQVNEVDGLTYFVSGAGGKLRDHPPDKFDEAGTTAWAMQGHFLLVEIDGEEMRVTPISGPDGVDGDVRLMSALTPENKLVLPPIVLRV